MNNEFADLIIDKVESLAAAIRDLKRNPTRTRHNFTATAAPVVGDDIDDGYSVGSQWANVSSLPATIYICRDNAVGAAVWFQIAP